MIHNATNYNTIDYRDKKWAGMRTNQSVMSRLNNTFQILGDTKLSLATQKHSLNQNKIIPPPLF